MIRISGLAKKVVSVDGNDVIFEATIAFSFAGGQESDKATINELPILDSRMEGKLITFTLQEGHGLCPGEQVTMKIDWPRDTSSCAIILLNSRTGHA